MIRVTVYLKSGAVAVFEAQAILDATVPHPKFRLDFPAPEQGGRRLVYLDRDDVSAVVVEEPGGDPGALLETQASVPVVVPEAIREEVQEVLAVATAGAADLPAP